MSATPFTTLVRKLGKEMGACAPQITNEVISQLFPKTLKVSLTEGCARLFRDGVNGAVRTILKNGGIEEDGEDTAQYDFASIDPVFRPFAERLSNWRYFVPSLHKHVDLPDLIANVDRLAEATQYMRMKGRECLVEARKMADLVAEIRRGS
jgi:hypothetical protein